MPSLASILGGIVVLLTAFCGPGLAAGETRWGASYLPNVPVVTQHGKTVRFYDDVLKGKTGVISFIYTTCRDICPLVTARLTQLEDRLGDLASQNIVFVSISIDPVVDTPAELKKFAEAFGVRGDNWVFLTGEKADIDMIRHRLGERSKFKTEHRNEILLYNDATGEWERSSVMGDINALAMMVHAMDPTFRNREGAAAALLQDARLKRPEPARPDNEIGRPGQGLFARLCVGCHTVGDGDKVGPDLYGLLSRRSRAWAVRYMVEPDRMRDDPVARELARRFPTIRMPNLELSEADAEDVLAYLQAQAYVVEAQRRDAARQNGQGRHPHHQHRHHHH